MDNWKPDLKKLFDDIDAKNVEKELKQKGQSEEAQAFVRDIVGPAFEEIKQELEKHGRQVTVNVGAWAAGININYNGNQELDLEIACKDLYPRISRRFIDRKDGKHYRSEGVLRSGGQDYSIKDVNKDEILAFTIKEYKEAIRPV